MLERCLDSIYTSAEGLGLATKVILVFNGCQPNISTARFAASNNVSLKFNILTLPQRDLVAARQTGWQSGDSTWVTFLDADDEITRQRFETLIANYYSHKVLIGRQVVVDTRDKKVGDDNQIVLNQTNPDFYINSMLVPRTFLERAADAPRTYAKLSEDWALVVRFRELKLEIVTVDEPFVRRHVHKSNASANLEEIRRGYFDILREHTQRIGPSKGS